MKLKATRKEILNSGKTVLKVGYCGGQFLLQHKTPFAYSSGSNGWACDYYDIDGVIISTGYAPIGQAVNYDILKKYEQKAQKIAYGYNLSYEKKAAQVDKLLQAFINETLTK